MRVLVTGASGHIRSAVVSELIAAGHEVVGLARSDTAAATVTALGATVRRGDLDDLDGLREAAADPDGVIHVAFKHRDALRPRRRRGRHGTRHRARAAGTGKPLVTASGTGTAGQLGRPNRRPAVEAADVVQ